VKLTWNQIEYPQKKRQNERGKRKNAQIIFSSLKKTNKNRHVYIKIRLTFIYLQSSKFGAL